MQIFMRKDRITSGSLRNLIGTARLDIASRSLTFISNKKSASLSNNRKLVINTIHEVFTAARLKRFAIERIYTRVILPDILY